MAKSSVPNTKAWREQYGFTQAEAALVLQVPIGTLQGWERSRWKTVSPAVGPVTLLMRYYDHYGPLPVSPSPRKVLTEVRN